VSSDAQFISLDLTLENPAPRFRLPKVPNARLGFFEDGEFAALLLARGVETGDETSRAGRDVGA
jgi:hypothetical protein